MLSRALFSIIACGIPFYSAADELANRARTVLRDHCYQCHNGPGSAGGDYDFLNRENLVDEGLVEPSDPDASLLVEYVLDGQMPPLAQQQRNPMSADEKQALIDWVQAGAPEFAQQVVEKQFLRLPAVLEGVRDFLRKQPETARPYLRFFTLHHQHNTKRVGEGDLALYRAALSKALNSLSWNRDIVLPRLIDAEDNRLHGAVLAIDLRDYVDSSGRSWADRNMWRRIAKAYPYGLAYPDFTADNRRELLREITQLLSPNSGILSQPVLRADWFVATATRPPLYHDLLGLPENAAELERDLKVNIRDAFQQPTPTVIARAGFSKSGVSGQNRLLERSRAANGAYWKSYDFKPDAKTASLVRFPLGPLNLYGQQKHPFSDQAFTHDGGEIIFNLPNQLQGYLLVDGQDRRIDAGPIAVVSDALKTSGTPEIVNGLSCMACHKHGMIPFADEIRSLSSVFGAAAEHVERLYPARAEMDRLVKQDRDRYLAALEAATGPFWRVAGEERKPIEAYPEPIGEAARLYRLVYLNADAIAAELDFESPEQLLERAGMGSVKSLGLEAVFKGRAVVSRNVWEASDGLSLMQDLAFEAGMTPEK